ncbi:MAG TPA: TPM domain-containing protein, partial [bacterium]
AGVKAAEASHRGELRMAVEGHLPAAALWHGQTPRERAIDVFSALRVWDTELNTGVLIYVQIADRAVEIVADRGINAKVRPEEWSAICAEMERAFGAGRFEEGAVQGLKAIAALLRSHFEAPSTNPDELPNRPVLL